MNKVSHADGYRFLQRVREENHGFLTASDVAGIAADERTRLTLLLVRCNGCRFLAPAQDVEYLIRLVESTGEEWVRDVSIPAEAKA